MLKEQKLAPLVFQVTPITNIVQDVLSLSERGHDQVKNIRNILALMHGQFLLL